MSSARGAVVLGLGQELAGDDAVGLAVARELSARGWPARTSSDASELVTLLEAGERVVLVDAVVDGGAPGDVRRLSPGALGVEASPVSSHGLTVRAALDLVCALAGEEALDRLDIVAVAIDRPAALATGLSPPVADAVGRAADLVEAIAREGALPSPAPTEEAPCTSRHSRNRS